MSKRLESFVWAGWIGTIFLLFLYSYTQVDLGLTLTRLSLWQVVQRNFQYIGYFNRPLSTALYLLILSLLFIFYFLIIKKVKRRQLEGEKLWKLILITSVILLFSFNAFSYDLFNYIFDARIVTFYHQNPYTHRALDFPGDPMLGFMHWTHRYLPYGPVWLVLTVPLSYLSFGKLLPAMFLFKGLAVASYLAACFYLYKILEKVDYERRTLGLAIFAFNPLVGIESLVSGHNDIIMIGLMMFSFWLLLQKKFALAWFFLFLSIGIKFATAALLPVFVLVTFFPKIKFAWGKIFIASFFLMILALFQAVRRTELQPWYLLYLLPFAGLVSGKKWLVLPVVFLSVGLLLHYVPFLLWGNWDPPVQEIRTKFTIFSFSFGILAYLVQKTAKKIRIN